jgi:glycosyltransferase involved in cell wall biosynthesis
MSSALAGCLFCCVAALHGTRTITVHSLADTEKEALQIKGWKGFWQRLFLRCVSRIVVVSPALHEGVARYFPSKATLIPYGVRDDLFRRSTDEVRQAFRRDKGVAQDNVVFCFLGTIGYRKGFDVLARAFADLTVEKPGWRLWVIGPRRRDQNQNVDEQEVSEVTRPLGKLNDKVVFWGRVDDRAALSQILSASDAFIFPSRREGMGIAPMEAMAVGVPVIVSRLPGVTDLVNIEGETGYYVPPADLDALKNAMLALGKDQGARRKMGEKASQVVRGRFGWEAYLSCWIDVYTESFRVLTVEKSPASEQIPLQA